MVWNLILVNLFEVILALSPPSESENEVLLMPVGHWKGTFLSWERLQLGYCSSSTYSPEMVESIAIQVPASSEVELILDVTESRSVGNFEVKLSGCELLLRDMKERVILGSLLKLVQVL